MIHRDVISSPVAPPVQPRVVCLRSMTPRGVWTCRLAGVAFTVTTLCTVIVNYVIAVGCRACYSASDGPLTFPDHLFISATLRKPPTRFSGLVGFSCTALFGLIAGVGRFVQIRDIAYATIDEAETRDKILKRNRASLKYLFIFAAALVGLCVAWPEEHFSLRTLMHYLMVFFTFASILIFLYLQIYLIERQLATLTCRSDAESSSPDIPFLDETPSEHGPALKSLRVMHGWLWVTAALALAFGVSVQPWIFMDEDADGYHVMAVIAAIFEVLTVSIGSAFFAVTDFTTVQSHYLNRRRYDQRSSIDR